MELVITPTGDVRCLYDETLDLRALGGLTIRRASHVEPDSNAQWIANLTPVGGPVLGPFPTRSYAFAAEAAWLNVRLLQLPFCGVHNGLGNCESSR